MLEQPIFLPRQYQLKIFDAIDRGYKRVFALWHRRAGKDISLWNLIAKKAIEEKGLYYYLLPTFTQAKRIIWDGITNDGDRFLSYIPKSIIKNTNATEMKIELINGSIIQLIGTDNYDSIRGTNPRGCVFSEFAFQNPMAWEVVKPILKVNKGWAIFNTTPNGKNHAYELFEIARNSPYWFSERLTINETQVLNENDMNNERDEGMSEEMIQQEYYCSFDIGTLGSYYSKQINEARQQYRICAIPIEKTIPVDLWLDLGKNDSTAIIFSQKVGKEIRLVDFYETTGEDIDHYVLMLQEKKYNYGFMHLPHDAYHKRLESKKSIQEQFEEKGFKTKRVPQASIENGIQEVRKLFPRFWFEKEKCAHLVRAIENYHKEWDEKAKVFRSYPKHDWSSHPCDALRYLAIGFKEDEPVTESYEQSVRKFLEDKSRKVSELGYTPEEFRGYERAAKDFLNK